MRKIGFIINPVSGTNSKERIIRQITGKMNLSPFNFDIHLTRYAHHARQIARQMAGEGFDTVVAVGGDGSVNDIVNSLAGSGVKLGIIPTGSGNGLAHYLKIPVKIEKAIDIVCRGKSRKIDTMYLNNHRFVNVAGVGFDAHISHKFSNLSRRGFWSYIKLVLSEYPRYQPGNYILKYGEKEIHRTALLISFANSNQFGNNIVISPDADASDGLIDVCILSKVSILETPLLGDLLTFRILNQEHYVERIKVPEVEIIQQKDQFGHIDGDAIAPGKELKIKVDPLSLEVIVP